MGHKIALLAVVALFYFSPRLGLAAEGSPIPPDGGERITALIEQLEHAAFSERQAASQGLAEAGSLALPHLETAAASGSREAAARALEIVKRHFQNGDGDLKDEARGVLSRLAKNDNPITAQRAENVLNPPRKSLLPAGMPFPVANARFGLPAPQFTRTMMTHEANGIREVDVRENGRRTKIQTFPNGKIQIEVTEPRNGRDETRRIEAKDLSELRRIDADAGQAYDLYDAAPRPFVPRTLPAVPRPLPVEPGRSASSSTSKSRG
jgi:hypothetical protein